MRAPRLADVALLMAFAIAPAAAQQSEPPKNQPQPQEKSQPPGPELNATAVGLPVYSSDGQKLGQVTEVGTTGGRPAVLADLAEFLGLGPRPVIIPADMFQHRNDRVELVMTAAEVRD